MAISIHPNEYISGNSYFINNGSNYIVYDSPTTEYFPPKITQFIVKPKDQESEMNETSQTPQATPRQNYLSGDRVLQAQKMEMDYILGRLSAYQPVTGGTVATTCLITGISGCQFPSIELVLNKSMLRDNTPLDKIFENKILLPTPLKNSYRYSGEFKGASYIVNVIVSGYNTHSFMHKFFSNKPLSYIHAKCFKNVLGMDYTPDGLYITLPINGIDRKIFLTRSVAEINEALGTYESSTVRNESISDIYHYLSNSKYIYRNLFSNDENIDSVDDIFINKFAYRHFINYVHTHRLFSDTVITEEFVKKNQKIVLASRFPGILDYIQKEEERGIILNMVKEKISLATNIVNNPAELDNFIQGYRKGFKSEQDFINTVLGSGPTSLAKKTGEYIQKSFNSILAPVPLPIDR